MALNALHSASTGLAALNTELDVVANNLANVNTAGFKSSRVNFQDLIYQEKALPGVENSNGDERPTGLYVGLGVKVSGTQLDFSQGAPIQTGRQLDVLIDGDGFFQIEIESDRGEGGLAYTRAGNFSLNSDGELVLANDQGRRLTPTISIDPNASFVEIGADGIVRFLAPGSSTPQQAGTIELATFVNPQGLKQIGENLYVQTDASRDPITGDPGQDNRGLLRSGFLESSNVNPTMELIKLIRTQRAFEMNSNVIRAADDTLRAVANLRR